MKKLLLVLNLLPLIAFSQSAIIKNLCPVIKHHRSNDSIRSIYYPLVNTPSHSISGNINNTIKSAVFGIKKEDTASSIQSLLNGLHKKYKGLSLSYAVSFNKNGFLSLTIHMVTCCEDVSAPIYLNFDLTTGKIITLEDLLKNKNDSISMRQAILPPITDSVRNFEQTIGKNNPRYSDIIEQLNSNLGSFVHSYPSDFIMTDKEIIFCFNCFLPANILNYRHTYRSGFFYKTLRNVFKSDVAKRLE